MTKISFKKFDYLFSKILDLLKERKYCSTNPPTKKELMSLNLVKTESEATAIISMIKTKADYRKVILKILWFHFDSPDTLWENKMGDMMRFNPDKGKRKSSRWHRFITFML